MRLIDADELIEFINGRISDGSEDPASQYTIIRDETLMEIGSKVKSMPTVDAEPHWIPCSEQLPPEENKTYWVCTDNGHQHECRWTNANPIWTHLTTDWYWNIFDIPQYTKVVAWMELPKPYDGGEQDG